MGKSIKDALKEIGKLLNDDIKEKVYYFNSVSDMKSSTKLKSGDMVITKGYYESNDGGSGEYEIVDDNTLTDDGGSVHDLTNGLKAKLIIKNGEVNVEQFGAKGDGVTDDTISIQNAITYSSSLNGTVLFNKKIYIISSPLTLKNNAKILGTTKFFSTAKYSWKDDFQNNIPQESITDSIIQYKSGIHGYIFDTQNVNRGINISNITIRNGGSKTNEDILFNSDVDGVFIYQCKIENLHSLFIDDTSSKQCIDWDVQENLIIGCNIFLDCIITDCFFVFNRFVSCQRCIVERNGSGANTIIGNRFEWGNKGIEIYGYEQGVSKHNIMIGNYFDALIDYGIGLYDGASYNLISNNQFYRCGRENSTDSSCYIYIRGINTSCNVMNNNTFKAGKADNSSDDDVELGAMYLVTLENCVDTNNEFRGNLTYDGYTNKPFNNIGVCDNSLIIDDIHIRNSTGDFTSIINCIKNSVCDKYYCKIHVYESKTITDFTGAYNFILIGHGDNIEILDSSGNLKANKYINLIYGKISFDNEGRANKIPTRSTWDKGNKILFNSEVAVDKGYVGAICISGGYPGTWKMFGKLEE